LPVQTLAIAGPSIFAGSLSIVGTSPATLIAKVSRTGQGAADSDWKNPLFNRNDGIYTLALDHQGYLYAGGKFSAVGDQMRRNIARFSAANGDLDQDWMAGEADGFPAKLSWQMAPIPTPVMAIAVDSKNNVFVGGSFDRSRYVSQGSGRNVLAKIDAYGKFDMAWSMGNSNLDYVNALRLDGVPLGVGGQLATFSNDNGYPLARTFSADTLNLNQQGLSGAWGRSNTPGTRQGLLFNFYPDNIAPGHGTVFAGWYTYDLAGGSGGQRWYALQGDVHGDSPSATLGIYTAIDGNLNAGQNPSSTQVGTATLGFGDCSTGMLVYAFHDGRSGSIPLSRVTQNTNCSTRGDRGGDPGNSLLTGTWIVPDTAGMGFVIDVSPANKTLFGTWYTYFPAGFPAGSPRQQWFVFQDGDFSPSATSSSDIDLLQFGGGTFDATVGGGVTSDVVGKVSLSFTSCTTATFTYRIWPNRLNSQSVSQNTVDLVRLGPAPAGCAP